MRKAFNAAQLELAAMGERVLGFCDLMLPVDEYPNGGSYLLDRAPLRTTLGGNGVASAISSLLITP